MVTDKIKELEKLRAQSAALEAEIGRDSSKELAALPSYYGFPTVAAFIKAVRAAAKGGGKSHSAPAKAPKKRTRAKITDEIKAKVIALANEGKTGAEIVKAVGISLPSVQNIKKAAGLVQARKTEAPAASQ